MYEDNSGWFVLIAIAVGLYLIIRVNVWKARAGGVQDVEKFRREMEDIQRKKNEEAEKLRNVVEKDRRDLTHAQQRFTQVLMAAHRKYPWVTTIHADLLAAEAESLSRQLERKKHPALKAAEEVRKFKDGIADTLGHLKYAQYKAAIYEAAFPFLIDLVEGAPADNLAAPLARTERSDDPARQFLTEVEYTNLASAEKSQLALERYKRRGKTNWEIGRDYERFVGYQYENLGWTVEFHGAVMGFDDLGRDLIARRPGQTLIIQCKYWAQWRDIHESAVFQLFGSMVDYLVEQRLLGHAPALLPDEQDVFSSMKRNGVSGVFVTSTQMSPRALVACDALRIKADTSIPLGEYPMIKCNVGRDGDRLYHLPFDQQYDRVKIEPEKGEFYATTAVEAEEQGFRRAFRWRSGPGS
jgi:hypothetical protein